MSQQEQLLEELSKERKNIKTDGYQMSVGELINLYKDGELELAPAFQRLFRWDDEQKSKFIESMVLGIPIPPIFVAQKEAGQWSVVDGVQRISTLLQLTGDLKGYDPLRLTTTKKLPSLQGLTWNDLPDELKRILRRAKLGINIILTENSIQSQYELFERLNTGGLHLEPQEIRNCLIIMLDQGFYDKLNKLKDYQNYKDCLPLQDDKFKIEHHMELMLRYFIAKSDLVDFSKYNASKTLLRDFLDEETSKLIDSGKFNLDDEIAIFKRVFNLLKSTLEKDSFKRYFPEKDRFMGAFLESSFEAIAPGLGVNIDALEKLDHLTFMNKIKFLYEQPDYVNYSDRGIKALNRIKGMTELSKSYFSK